MSGQHNQRLAVTELFNVTDWVVVVTGGGTGIGLMIAQGFANNGARVYIVGRRLEVLEDAVKTWGHSLVHAKGKIIPIQGDVSEKEGIQKVVEAVKCSEDHVDVLVNNAGINATDSSQVEKGDDSAQGLYDELWKQMEEEWMQIYKTNVIGCVSFRLASHRIVTFYLGISSLQLRFFLFSQLPQRHIPITRGPSSTSRP